METYKSESALVASCIVTGALLVAFWFVGTLAEGVCNNLNSPYVIPAPASVPSRKGGNWLRLIKGGAIGVLYLGNKRFRSRSETVAPESAGPVISAPAHLIAEVCTKLYGKRSSG